MRRAALAAALALLAAAAGAEERPITADVLLDRLEGRVMTFRHAGSGKLVGDEEFLSRTRSQWRDADGRCVRGKITIDRDAGEGGAICFRYEDRPGVEFCWTAFEADGVLSYRSTMSGEVQTITPAAPNAARCEGVPMS